MPVAPVALLPVVVPVVPVPVVPDDPVAPDGELVVPVAAGRSVVAAPVPDDGAVPVMPD